MTIYSERTGPHSFISCRKTASMSHKFNMGKKIGDEFI